MPRPNRPLQRRQFLTAGSAFASTVILSAASPRTSNAGETSSAAASSTLKSGEPVLLKARPGNDLMQVRFELEVKGNVDVPNNPLVSRTSQVKLPIKSDAVFEYEERYRRPSGADPGSIITAVERFYHEANSESELNRNRQVVGLRDSVRQTIVRREMLPEVIYAADDYFHHDELDLLRLPASSVAVDRLLPTEAVNVGDSYQPSRDVLCSVLNLTSVDSSDVKMEVSEITEATAKLQLGGNIDGSVEGVPTRLRLVGKLTFDRALGTCTWLAMAIHETREIGKAEPGFDVAAMVKMVRKPMQRPLRLPQEPAEIAMTAAIPTDRLYVELSSEELGVTTLMDRRWRMMADVPGSAMMRMIELDRSIAQCNFKPLATLVSGQQWTLEAFQQDVRETLGDQLNQMIDGQQYLSDSGLRVLRITAQGEVEGVPIQWIVLHFSDDLGRRVLATFIMDGESIEAFAGSDVQLASTLRFTDRVSAGEQSLPENVPGTLGNASVQSTRNVVDSASDLR